MGRQEQPDFDVLIAGAGIVGASCALWSAMRGLKVALADPAPPGSGASFGNACTIATYAILPAPNDPAILRRLPRLLTHPESPLSIDWRHALSHPGWMLRLLANCTPGRVDHIIAATAALLEQADAGLNPLIEEARAQDLIVDHGCLYVWSTEAGFRGAARAIARRREFGIDFDILEPDDLRALEPRLVMDIHKGLRFNGARHVLDPQALVSRMVEKTQARGGVLIGSGLAAAEAEADGVRLRLSDGSAVKAGRVVIAAGAMSRSIAGAGTAGLPLDTERGYHVMWPSEGGRLSRPVGWEEAGFYAVPMAGGLRCAGTVEIAGLARPANPRRTAYIARRARQMFGDLGAPGSTWLGFRPTFPDALPVIGPSPANGRILLAFGHQHLGLTLGGITGRLIADLLTGRTPPVDLAPYSAGRF